MTIHADDWGTAVLEAWRHGPGGIAEDGEPNLMSRQAAAYALQRLLSQHTQGDLTAAAEESLGRTASSYGRGKLPNPRDRAVATATLQLVTLDNGLVISKETAKAVVAAFDAGYWFAILRDLIASYLSDVDVLECLETSLQPRNDPQRMLTALEGLRLYAGAADRPGDPNLRSALVDRVVKRLEELTESRTPEIKASANAALHQFTDQSSATGDPAP